MKKVFVSMMIAAAIAFSGTVAAQDSNKKGTCDKQKTECTKNKKECTKDKKECTKDKKECCKKSDSKSCDKK